MKYIYADTDRWSASVSLATSATTRRRVESEILLGESGELIIEHAGQEYRLRRTRHGRLILTK